MNMKDFILNELPISSEIKEKIDLVEKSKLSYEDFNNYRFLMKMLENYKPNYKLSEEKVKQNTNSFIANFIKDLNSIVENIKNQHHEKEIQKELDFTKSPNTSFYEILAIANNFKEQKNIDSQKAEEFLNNLDSLVLKQEHSFDDEQKQVINEIRSALSEYTEKTRTRRQ